MIWDCFKFTVLIHVSPFNRVDGEKNDLKGERNPTCNPGLRAT